MNRNREEHHGTPDPDFASRLRWQLASEFRRQSQFSENKKNGSWIKTILILAVALITGFAAAAAAQRYRDSARADLLIAQEEAMVELGEARLELARSYMSELEEQYQEDPDLRETVVVTEFELHQIERELERNRVNLEEVRLTGRSPRDSLTAPRISGRDFVTRRLQIEEEALLERMELFNSEISRLRSSPTESEYSLEYARLELSSLQEQLERVREQMRVRQEYLDGEKTAREVALQSNLANARARLAEARQRVGVVEREFEKANERYQKDETSSLDLKQAEFQLIQARTEQQLAQMEHDFLIRQLGINSP